eukprot:930883-Prymnesium_polylepis.1
MTTRGREGVRGRHAGCAGRRGRRARRAQRRREGRSRWSGRRTLLTLVSTMKVVAVTSCCTRRPAYEIASPLTHESTRSSHCDDVSRPNASPHSPASPYGSSSRPTGSRPKALLRSIMPGFEMSTGSCAIRWRCISRSSTAKSMLRQMAANPTAVSATLTRW